MTSPLEKETYAALIGIDCADQKHDYCLGVVGSDSVEIGMIASRPEDVAAWIHSLRKRFKGQQIALCLEQSKGALIHQLMSVEFIDIYPINRDSTYLAKIIDSICLRGGYLNDETFPLVHG